MIKLSNFLSATYPSVYPNLNGSGFHLAPSCIKHDPLLYYCYSYWCFVILTSGQRFCCDCRIHHYQPLLPSTWHIITTQELPMHSVSCVSVTRLAISSIFTLMMAYLQHKPFLSMKTSWWLVLAYHITLGRSQVLQMPGPGYRPGVKVICTDRSQSLGYKTGLRQWPGSLVAETSFLGRTLQCLVTIVSLHFSVVM